MPVPPPSPDTRLPAALDERYGRTPGRLRATRRGAWIAAAAFVVVFAAWVVWGGLDGTASKIEAVDTGFTVIDDHGISVSWQTTLTPGTSASCAVEARNEQHAIVGWEVVDLPASERLTRSFTEELATTELAVTGLIYRCWLT
jgi:hypothetical protein